MPKFMWRKTTNAAVNIPPHKDNFPGKVVGLKTFVAALYYSTHVFA